MEHASPFKALVADAKQRINEVSIDDVKQWQAAGESFYFIDTREDSEFVRGALPDAIHLGKGIIERDINEVVADKDAKIVLYCGGGSRSALAADNLQKMGYTQVYSMAGGFRGWRA
jgi:rhodanese-related sulfurtransferase